MLLHLWALLLEVARKTDKTRTAPWEIKKPLVFVMSSIKQPANLIGKTLNGIRGGGGDGEGMFHGYELEAKWRAAKPCELNPIREGLLNLEPGKIIELYK